MKNYQNQLTMMLAKFPSKTLLYMALREDQLLLISYLRDQPQNLIQKLLKIPEP